MIDSLEEVIKRFTNNAEYERTHGNLQGCLDFKQLAEWLQKLKAYEKQPCEECKFQGDTSFCDVCCHNYMSMFADKKEVNTNEI